MKVLQFALLATAFLLIAGCSTEVNEPSDPMGLAMRVSVPENLSAVAADALEGHEDVTLCSEGTPSACARLAFALEGAQTDAASALAHDLHRSLCEVSYAGSCLAVARLSDDAEEAWTFSKRGCELGHQDSCQAFAHLQAEEEQVGHLMESCLQGNRLACDEVQPLAARRSEPPAARVVEALEEGDEESEEADESEVAPEDDDDAGQ